MHQALSSSGRIERAWLREASRFRGGLGTGLSIIKISEARAVPAIPAHAQLKPLRMPSEGCSAARTPLSPLTVHKCVVLEVLDCRQYVMSGISKLHRTLSTVTQLTVGYLCDQAL